MSQVLVDCRNVSKSFGSVQALRDVNFQIMEGESVALVGPNGGRKNDTHGSYVWLFVAFCRRASCVGRCARVNLGP